MRRRDLLRTTALASAVIAMGWAVTADGADATPPTVPNWIVADNQPCRVYNPYPEPGESVTWSGGCVDGKAEGEGQLVWRSADSTKTYEGHMRAGKFHQRVRCPVATAASC